MDIDRAVLFVIMWGIPVFAVVRGYLKMDRDERNSAKSDFKRLDFIFTTGFLILGLFTGIVGTIDLWGVQ